MNHAAVDGRTASTDPPSVQTLDALLRAPAPTESVRPLQEWLLEAFRAFDAHTTDAVASSGPPLPPLPSAGELVALALRTVPTAAALQYLEPLQEQMERAIRHTVCAYRDELLQGTAQVQRARQEAVADVAAALDEVQTACRDNEDRLAQVATRLDTALRAMRNLHQLSAAVRQCQRFVCGRRRLLEQVAAEYARRPVPATERVSEATTMTTTTTTGTRTERSVRASSLLPLLESWASQLDARAMERATERVQELLQLGSDPRMQGIAVVQRDMPHLQRADAALRRRTDQLWHAAATAEWSVGRADLGVLLVAYQRQHRLSDHVDGEVARSLARAEAAIMRGFRPLDRAVKALSAKGDVTGGESAFGLPPATVRALAAAAMQVSTCVAATPETSGPLLSSAAAEGVAPSATWQREAWAQWQHMLTQVEHSCRHVLAIHQALCTHRRPTDMRPLVQVVDGAAGGRTASERPLSISLAFVEAVGRVMRERWAALEASAPFTAERVWFTALASQYPQWAVAVAETARRLAAASRRGREDDPLQRAPVLAASTVERLLLPAMRAAASRFTRLAAEAWQHRGEAVLRRPPDRSPSRPSNAVHHHSQRRWWWSPAAYDDWHRQLEQVMSAARQQPATAAPLLQAVAAALEHWSVTVVPFGEALDTTCLGDAARRAEVVAVHNALWRVASATANDDSLWCRLQRQVMESAADAPDPDVVAADREEAEARLTTAAKRLRRRAEHLAERIVDLLADRVHEQCLVTLHEATASDGTPPSPNGRYVQRTVECCRELYESVIRQLTDSATLSAARMQFATHTARRFLCQVTLLERVTPAARAQIHTRDIPALEAALRPWFPSSDDADASEAHWAPPWLSVGAQLLQLDDHALTADACAELERAGLPLYLLAHHLISRSDGALQQPYRRLGWSALEYARWMEQRQNDGHTQAIYKVLQSTLDQHAQQVRHHQRQQLAPQYALLLQLLQHQQ